jgi:hypothetical protein
MPVESRPAVDVAYGLAAAAPAGPDSTGAETQPAKKRGRPRKAKDDVKAEPAPSAEEAAAAAIEASTKAAARKTKKARPVGQKKKT